MSPPLRTFRGVCLAISLAAASNLNNNLKAQLLQEARVANSSLKIEPLTGAKKIDVTLRLVDTPAITVALASSGSGSTAKQLPVSWTSFDSMDPATCAWMVIIDSSNPARLKTVEACVSEVGAFLTKVPKGDSVMIASLARDLNVVSGFEATREQSKAALSNVKVDGDAALSTLIYQNVKQALIDYLGNRKETRKSVLLFTDGKDETPGGSVAVTSRRDELISAAKKLSIPVHTLGFAEKATEMNFFADIKDVAIQTDGLHVPAVVSTRSLPGETWETLIGVMHGGGKAVLDIATLTEVAPVELELKTASGKTARVLIPKQTVAEALPKLTAPKPTPKAEPSKAAPVTGTSETNKEKKTPAGDVKAAAESDKTSKEKKAPAGNVKPGAESDRPAMAIWVWGAITAVAIVLIFVAIISSKRRAAEEERRAAALREEQARKLEEMLAKPEAPTTLPPPAPLAFLEMCDATQTRNPLTVKGVKIGRGKHNDIVIGNDSVSGSHCVLSLRNDEWTVVDLKSGNGVLVNGKQVSQATLRPNDVIELGDIKMRFLLNK